MKQSQRVRDAIDAYRALHEDDELHTSRERLRVRQDLAALLGEMEPDEQLAYYAAIRKLRETL